MDTYLLFIAAMVMAHVGIGINNVSGQSSDAPIQLAVFVDREYASTSTLQPTQMDSLDKWINQALIAQQNKGYFLATLDSVRWDRTGEMGAVYITNGPQLLLSRIALSGIGEEERDVVAGLLDTKTGVVLDPLVLTADVERILGYYEEEGYPFVKVSVADVQLSKDNEQGIDLLIEVEKGGKARVNDVLIIGANKTRQSYIEYLMGIRQGDLLKQDLDAVRNKLTAAEHFEEVYPIELIEVGEEEYLVVVQVKEATPGTFDLVLGYQPPANNANNGGLVGNGHLDLRNMFGMGRQIALRLNRLPGQISALEASYADEYFWGSPLSVEAGFQGLQQDSTYNQQAYRAAIGYRLFDGLGVFATLNRETVRPGQSGVQIVQQRQRIARSEISFWGFSIRYKRIDSPINPRAGMHMEVGVEGGRKRRTEFLLEAAGDTTVSTQRLQQQRLNLSLRGYIPVFSRQTVVIGNDTRILVSDDFDESDLFRLGGARSLRGYDEDRFRGRAVSRLLFEWRYLFERTSYAYLFFDAGFVDRPATPDFGAEQKIYPGYGLGMQFQTGIGSINTSLALSTLDAPSQAKIHVGLSFGL